MIDQAQGLRLMMNKQKKNSTRIITITSGKGGVGKSSFTINLAIALQRKGRKVLIIDSDFGFSNIDVMLGVNTKSDLTDVVNHNKDISEIIEVGHEGVKFISGGSGVYELTKLSGQQLMAIVNNLYSLENVADTILFDTSAGVSDNMLRLIRASHETILITTPEPTAVVDAYALVKIISEEENANLSMVVNKVSNSQEAETVMNAFSEIVKRNLGVEINRFGFVKKDVNMEKAIKMQTPILISFPKCSASDNIDSLASKYLNMPAKENDKLGIGSFIEKFFARKNFKIGVD